MVINFILSMKRKIRKIVICVLVLAFACINIAFLSAFTGNSDGAVVDDDKIALFDAERRPLTATI